MFMRHLKHKKIFAIIFGSILLIGACILLFSFKDQITPSTAVPSPMSDPALKQAIADYYYVEIDKNGEDYFDETCRTPEDGDYEAINHDLDGDGVNEFIVSINFYCGHPLRSPSGGHGDYVIFRKEGDEYTSQGSVFGNSYGVASQVKSNGRSVIYTTEKANAKYSFIHEWHWNPRASVYEQATPNFSPTIQPMITTTWVNGMDYPVYAFFKGKYSTEAEPILEVGAQNAITDPMDGGLWGGRYFTKDITGDGEPEIFIQMEANGHGNRWYQILQWQYGSFQKLTVEGTENEQISFNEIDYKDGFVYATWHGNFERGMTQYALTGNKLVRVKDVGLYTQDYNDTTCSVRQINVRQDQTVSTTHLGDIEDCQLWTENLDDYFEQEVTASAVDDLWQTYEDGKHFILTFERLEPGIADGWLVVTTDGAEVWRHFITGLMPYKYSYKFYDHIIGGLPRVWVHTQNDPSDALGIYSYYIWNGQTFEPIEH